MYSFSWFGYLLHKVGSTLELATILIWLISLVLFHNLNEAKTHTLPWSIVSFEWSWWSLSESHDQQSKASVFLSATKKCLHLVNTGFLELQVVENLERIRSGRTAPRRGLTDSEIGWSGNTYIWSMLGTMLTRLLPLSIAAGMAWKQCSAVTWLPYQGLSFGHSK